MPNLKKYAFFTAAILAAMTAAAPSPFNPSNLEIRHPQAGGDGGDGGQGGDGGDGGNNNGGDGGSGGDGGNGGNGGNGGGGDYNPSPSPKPDPKPNPNPNPYPNPGTCGTCNPISGLNGCDITTSCINTGTQFHCACRAGYKAGNKNDFRIRMPNYEFLVFVPTGQTCNALCNNPFGYGPELCREVPLLPVAQCRP